MRKLVTGFLLAVVLVSAGCTDKRIKRQSAYVNARMQDDNRRFGEAKTLEEKLKVAEEHFRDLPKHTQVLDDYMHKRKPKGPKPD